ncbi:MAG: PAS domain S-box protein [Rhodospirillaceae bacterium]|nr:PAS domain S-box protein [Rhodospirillaceae bacterium]
MFDEMGKTGRPADAAVEQAWFQAIFQHAAFGISLISPDNLYLGVNPAYERMMGYGAAELVGRPKLAITHPDDAEASNDLNRRMDSGEINEFTLDKRYLRPDGSEFFGRLKVSRVNDENGRILFKLAMVENISELKQREQALHDSEARLAEAQRIANMGNWEFVAERGTVHWSDECYRIFGQDKDSFSPSHETFLACVHPDDRERVKRVLIPGWRPKGRYSHEHRIVRPDGEVRHLQEWVVPYYDETGAVIRRVGAVQDITERKQADQALRKSERQLQQSTDNVPALIAFIGNDRRYQFANLAYEKWYGLSPENIIGRTVTEVLGAANAQQIESYIAGALAGERQDYLVSFDTAGSVRREVKGTFMSSKADDGTVLGFHVLAQDVTKEKMAEEALLHAKDMAEDASRAKSNFLASMSHELRTPLNAIIGFSEIIAKEILGPVGKPEYLEYAQDIHNSGGLLLDIIGEILDYSKLESGKEPLLEESLDVPETVRSCLALVANIADQGGLKVESDVAASLPPFRADKRKLVQMLSNLLSNAIKFTEAGGCIGVRVRAAPEIGYEFQVYDNGIGIAAEDIARALLPFEQVDNSLTRKFPGTGLGLPLCKSFAEMHGGTFELTSAPGKGTTVTLRFPAERADFG